MTAWKTDGDEIKWPDGCAITDAITPRWIEIKRDGKAAWLDMVDGKFAFGGDLEPTEAARIFLNELGRLLDERVHEAAQKIAAGGQSEGHPATSQIT